SFAQTSFSRGRVCINFCDHCPLNVLWKIQRGANVIGDIRHCDATKHSRFLRLRTFFRRRFGTSFLGHPGRHLSKLNIEHFCLTFAIHLICALRPGAIEPIIKRSSRASLIFFPFPAVITSPVFIPAFCEGVFGATSPTSAPVCCPLSFIASASSGVSGCTDAPM